jgi:hypothetical protein
MFGVAFRLPALGLLLLLSTLPQGWCGLRALEDTKRLADPKSAFRLSPFKKYIQRLQNSIGLADFGILLESARDQRSQPFEKMIGCFQNQL